MPAVSKKERRRAPKTPRRDPLTDALAAAAWAEADLALASAVASFAELEVAPNASARAEAMVLLGQALAQAARRRGLARFGEAGAAALYEPSLHEAVGSLRLQSSVRILSAGIKRGDEILVKARVAPASNKKRK